MSSSEEDHLSPKQTIAHRFSEGAPGLMLGAYAVGLENHRQLLRDHARRVADAHLAQMRAAGIQGDDATMATDEMGDIIITGDINHPDLANMPWRKRVAGEAVPDPIAQPLPPPAAIPAPSRNKWLWPVVAAASGLGIGTAGAGTAMHFLQKPAVEQSTTTEKTEGFNLRLED